MGWGKLMVDFPQSPVNGQQHVEGGQAWTYQDPPGAWVVGEGKGTALEIVESGAGWQVWGDVLVQWGTGDTVGGLAPVVFIQQFAATPTVTAAPDQNNGDATITVDNVAVDRFDAFTRNTGGGTTDVDFQWIAIGEAPDDLKKPKEIASAAGSDILVVDEGSGYQIIGTKMIAWGITTSVGTANINWSDTFPVPFDSPPSLAVIPVNFGNIIPSISEDAGGSLTETGFAGRTQTPGGGSAAGRSVAWIAMGDATPDRAMPTSVIGNAAVTEFHDPTGVSSWRLIGNTLECWGEVNSDRTWEEVTFGKTFARRPAFTVGFPRNSSAEQSGRYATAGEVTTTFGRAAVFQDALSGLQVGDISWHAIGEWDGQS